MWSRVSVWLLPAIVAIFLVGCASFTMQTQFNNETELLEKRGQPATIWENDDGTRTFEYSTQPYGESAWMYTIDDKGVIVEQFDALATRNHGRVEADMTIAEVQRTLGQHRSTQKFARSGEEVWDWNVPNDQPGVVRTFFNVHFVEGVVKRTSYSYVYPLDSQMMFGFGVHHGFPHWGIGFGHSFGYPFGHPFGHSYARWPYYW